jgi:hypothetical protein
MGSSSHSFCEKPMSDSICGLTYISLLPPSSAAMNVTAGMASTSAR